LVSLAEIIAAAFIAGVEQEAKKRSKKAGKDAVSGLVDNLDLVPMALDVGNPVGKARRKPSKYAKAYGKAFKEVSPRYKTKSGSWKKDGFKNAQKAAHKLAKKRV